jgi:L-fucose isomerase-like protein
VVTSLPDPKIAQHTLGIEILACESSHLLDSYRLADEVQVKRLVDEWMRAAESIQEPKVTDLQKSARFHLAVKGLLKEFGAHAFAINCIPLVEELKATPCLALVRMNDEGIPAACEGDLTALMTMIVMERLADRPTFMGNIVYAHPNEHTIEVNHCVLPLRVCGYD